MQHEADKRITDLLNSLQSMKYVQRSAETEGFADRPAELPAVADAFKQVNEGKMKLLFVRRF